MAPTHEAIQVFTSQDITKDSRYEGTFTTAYYGNWEKAGISRIAYPGLWKLGCYRTDYDFATQLGSPNAGSTRTIEDYMYLRPIPQGQLNGMDMTDAEKAAYQNPGYPVE